MEFIVEVSARHVHLSKKDAETLFGENFELTKVKDLSQPGQYLSQEKVTLKNGDKVINNVSVLGPFRNASQAEISKTDSFTLKTECAIRESGSIEDTPGVTLVGPKGEVRLDNGLIVAQRHLHMTPADAEKFHVKDKQVVAVCVNSQQRSIVFGDVVVRVSPNFSLAMHVDTDEANAANLSAGATGRIVTIS